MISKKKWHLSVDGKVHVNNAIKVNIEPNI